MFPNDASTTRADIQGNTTTQLLSIPSSSTYTVLYESFNTGSKTQGASLDISCSNVKLLNVNDFSNVPQIERQKHQPCTDFIKATTLNTTGNPTTTIQIIYVPYDLTKVPTQDNTLHYANAILIVIAIISLFNFIRSAFSKHTR